MNYTHHAQEILELTTDEIVTLSYGNWETNPNKTGQGTTYNQEIRLTTPKGYNDKIYDYLTRYNYDCSFGTPIWVTGNNEMLTINLQTSQTKRKEILTERLSECVYLYFENGRLL